MKKQDKLTNFVRNRSGSLMRKKFKGGRFLIAILFLLVIGFCSSSLGSTTPDLPKGLLKWKIENPVNAESSPAVSDGLIFINRGGGNLSALNATTGEEQWVFTPNRIAYSQDFDPIIAQDGFVYAGYYTTVNRGGLGVYRLYALDSQYGLERWIYMTKETSTRDLEIHNDTIFVGGFSRFWGILSSDIYVLNAITGEELMQSTETGQVSSLAEDENIIFASNNSGVLYALDAATGKTIWKFTTADVSKSHPAISNGLVYVGSLDHNLYALDRMTGTVVWKFETNDQIWSGPAVSKGIVYVGSNDHNLYAINATTGTKQWEFNTGDQIWSSPVVSEGVVYVGSNDHNLYAIDGSNGKGIETFETSSNITSGPTISNGIIYVQNQYDGLYAFEVPDSETA